MWEKDRSNMRKLAKKVNELELRPDFIFITGDLRHVFKISTLGYETA